MLYLSRKVGDSIVINNTIVMTVTEVRGKTVKIGFSFPANATILRKEVHDRISAENKAAMAGGNDLGDLDFEIDFDLDQDDQP